MTKFPYMWYIQTVEISAFIIKTPCFMSGHLYNKNIVLDNAHWSVSAYSCQLSTHWYRCHVSNALPWKLTPPSICNNQLYYKVTPRVIVLWLPSHFATTGLHCKMTPHFEMTPNKQYYASYVENNLWYCFIVFLSFITKIYVCIALRFWNPN